MFEKLSQWLNQYSGSVELGRTAHVRAHELQMKEPGLSDGDAIRIARDEVTASLRIGQINTRSFKEVRAWSRRFLCGMTSTPSLTPAGDDLAGFANCDFALAAEMIGESLRMAKEQAGRADQEAYLEPKFAEALQRFFELQDPATAHSLLVVAPHLETLFQRCSPGGDFYDTQQYLRGR